VVYDCAICEGAERATLLLTPLSGAPSTALGDNCIPLALVSIAANSLGLEAGKAWDALLELSGNAAEPSAGPDLPPGMIYAPDGETILSEADVDAGLCGIIHDDWKHCHRDAKHTGRHNRQPPFSSEPDIVSGPPAEGADAPGSEV
jgi:hypothetical protein